MKQTLARTIGCVGSCLFYQRWNWPWLKFEWNDVLSSFWGICVSVCKMLSNPVGCVKHYSYSQGRSELRSCVKVEVAVLGSPSLIVLTVSEDLKQHWTWTGKVSWLYHVTQVVSLRLVFLVPKYFAMSALQVESLCNVCRFLLSVVWMVCVLMFTFVCCSVSGRIFFLTGKITQVSRSMACNTCYMVALYILS